MSIRHQFATLIARSSRWFLTRFTRGGSSLPGKLALSIDPHYLMTIAKNYDVIIVTGTNGKTQTTSLIVKALKQQYDHVITNESGSNMKQGVVGAFLSDTPPYKGWAVLEVDEGSLKQIAPEVNPKAFVHTNIFNDQLDRYGSAQNVYQLLADAASAFPEATLFVNGDLPLLNSVNLPNPRYFFGFSDCDHYFDQTEPNTSEDTHCPRCQTPLKYHWITYDNQGAYYCDNCHYQRPALDYQVMQIDQLTGTDSTFYVDNQRIHLPNAGVYNIYNALAAYAVANTYGVPSEAIADAFEASEKVFGRQEKMTIGDKDVTFNLVKNTVGLNQALDLLLHEQTPYTLVFIFNNKEADGVDLGWLANVDWDKLTNQPIKEIVTSGQAVAEITKAIKQSPLNGISLRSISSTTDLIDHISNAPTEKVYILANYTAMLDFRAVAIK